METSPAEKTIPCYTIPGLGGTPDIFQKLVFPPHIRQEPVEWLANRRGESLQQYARRLIPQIDTSQPFILLGYSFGAAIAIEMAKQISPLLTVIISGVKTEAEMPYYLGRAELFGAYTMSVFVHDLWRPLLRLGSRIGFGTNDPTALDMLVKLIQDADPHFYQWGLRALMDWDNKELPPNTFQIHGDKDRILPLRYVKPDVVIPGGGHLIVYTHGAEIGQLIAEQVAVSNKAPLPQQL